MKQFLSDDFLLKTKTAVELYDYAKTFPIIDYHCHIDAKEIYEDKKFKTITEVWLGGDHYKWRQMRADGVDEELITGNASDYDKFYAWTNTIQYLIGNPLFHWSNLELQRYFDCDTYLNTKNAKEIYDKCNKRLETLTARKIIEMSNVEIICTTDDPVDDLHYHKLLAKDETFKTKVFPTFRPDKLLNIEKAEFNNYITRLAEVAELKITNLDELLVAIHARIEFFNSLGCRASDHALEYVFCEVASKEDVDKILVKKLNGEETSELENLQYKTYILTYLSSEYKKVKWAMQLHYGCCRNNNSEMFRRLGPDTGFDAINSNLTSENLAKLLDHFNETGVLTKTILYSLNDNDNDIIVSTMNCFQNSSARGLLQIGSAWWFNDHIDGMTRQIKSLANGGNLKNFVGMLTDSRSFLSYARHEYFRRILCNILGEWVENGEYPYDMDLLKTIVGNVCYNNTRHYFNYYDED